MAIGIEVAGLALAVLPLLVNQIDAYARGIEKIRGLRKYRRELRTYCTKLKTQHTILQSTLEQALENVVEDEEAVADLIRDPQGIGWQDPRLQSSLSHRLGRSYGPFLGNMCELSELLERLSKRLGVTAMDAGCTNSETRSLWTFPKVLSVALYDDLLEEIDMTNTILRTLIEQADHQDKRRKRHAPWTRLLKKYQSERQHAESLFQAIAGGHCWQCHCREQHCVYLQLQANLVEHASNPSNKKSQSTFRIVFSNVSPTNPTNEWDWREVMFEPQRVAIPHISTLSVNEQSVPPPKKPGVCFMDIPEETTPISTQVDMSTAQIQDLCSSLQTLQPPLGQQNPIGFISEDYNPAYRYVMHAAQSIQHNALKHSLREALTSITRRDRLHIAAAISCAVLQYHGNWLKDRWNSSDFHLIAETLSSVFLSWPLSTPCSLEGSSTSSSLMKRESILHSLGLSLVELSLGRPLDTIPPPRDTQGVEPTIINTALGLTKEVHLESGLHYAKVVDSCLSWSGVSTICQESCSFEERVFDRIVSPLLKDLMIFEGIA